MSVSKAAMQALRDELARRKIQCSPVDADQAGHRVSIVIPGEVEIVVHHDGSRYGARILAPDGSGDFVENVADLLGDDEGIVNRIADAIVYACGV
jgi:hypothetical protein